MTIFEHHITNPQNLSMGDFCCKTEFNTNHADNMFLPSYINNDGIISMLEENISSNINGQINICFTGSYRAESSESY